MPNIIRRGCSSTTQTGPTVVRRGRSTDVDQEQAALVGTADTIVTVTENLTQQITQLETTSTQNAVRTLAIDLPPGRRGGYLIVEPPEGFAAEHVGAPVAVTLAPFPRRDEAEGAALVFTAEVVSRTRMRLHYSASGPPPARVAINYVVGGST